MTERSIVHLDFPPGDHISEAGEMMTLQGGKFRYRVTIERITAQQTLGDGITLMDTEVTKRLMRPRTDAQKVGRE